MMILYFPPDVVSHSLSLRPSLLRGHAPWRRDDVRLDLGRSLPNDFSSTLSLEKETRTSFAYITSIHLKNNIEHYCSNVTCVQQEGFRCTTLIKCFAQPDKQVLGRYHGTVMLRIIWWWFLNDILKECLKNVTLVVFLCNRWTSATSWLLEV